MANAREAHLIVEGDYNRVSECNLWTLICHGSGNQVFNNSVVSGEIGMSFFGSAITVDGSYNWVFNNIACSNQVGITVRGMSNWVYGNRVGTIGGILAAPNTVGMVVEGHSNRIGGTEAGHCNYISGNETDGLRIRAGRNHVIEGNYIGLGENGVVLSNGWAGISIDSGFAGEPIEDVLIGGIFSFSANVIAFNGQGGIVAWSTTSHARGLRILRNWVGVMPDGYVCGNGTGNTADGVRLLHQENPFIQTNIIGGHYNYGVLLQLCTNAVLEGNAIGTDGTGTNAAPNRQAGLYLLNVSNTRVGGD